MKSYVSFVHGEKTCVSEEGDICQFVVSRPFGIPAVCRLFNIGLYEVDGRLQRCKACLKKAKEL